jgi:DNA-binding transcriptional regulator YhcF (GntR family)
MKVPVPWCVSNTPPSSSSRYALATVLGSLTVGDQLPTVRQLAVNLSINPDTTPNLINDLPIYGHAAVKVKAEAE